MKVCHYALSFFFSSTWVKEEKFYISHRVENVHRVHNVHMIGILSRSGGVPMTKMKQGEKMGLLGAVRNAFDMNTERVRGG